MKDQLDGRLLSCAEYVRAGAVFADIGTDHGYLPIFLLEKGRIDRAILADINEGPLSSARDNAAGHQLLDKCSFYLTDGVTGLSELGITDLCIAGMGGELIYEIIEAGDFLKSPRIRLILQPMTKQEHLRRYLRESGFAILGERYSYADGKFYVTMLAEYSGECEILSATDAYIGEKREHIGDRVEFFGYFEKLITSLRRAVDGKRRGGIDTSDMEKTISNIEAYINDEKRKAAYNDG